MHASMAAMTRRWARVSRAPRGVERIAVAAEDICHLQRGTHCPRCYSAGIE